MLLTYQDIVMDPNMGTPVTNSTTQLVQRNQLLHDWLSDCLSMSTTELRVWTSKWIKSLRLGLGKADLETIQQGYQQLTEQLNTRLKLKPQSSTDEDQKNDWVSALLLQLLVMYVYSKTAAKKFYPDQLVEFKTETWEEHATQVMKTVPKEAYAKQLSRLVRKGILQKEQPIDRTVDCALFRIHQHALNFYFQQLMDGLRNTTQDYPPLDEENNAYKLYIDMICRLDVYISQLSALKPEEKELLPNQLLSQLTKLIEESSTLDLSPSWVERLKQWIQKCINQLKLLYITTPSVAENSSLQLLAISERLLKSTKEAIRHKKLQSPELIREGCWLYFSLHEQLFTQCLDKKKHVLEYQSTALALFENFMSTFDWPVAFKKGILHENPLKSSGWFTRFKQKILHHTAKQEMPVEDWEHLVDPALNKLCTDFFMKDWARNHGSPSERSFLYWLLSRQEPRLIAKIKAHVNTEEMEYQRLNEISTDEKINLYGFVQEIHKDFCTDLNQITQMVLSVWFQKIGFNISHKDLGNVLSKPGRWLCQTDQALPTRMDVDIPFFALFMFQAVERLGAGVYFFPPLQQHWFSFQEALAIHSGNAAEFVHQHDEKISAIIKKLRLIFHTDHKPEAHNNPRLKGWAQRNLPQIQSVKHDLEEFRKRAPNELQNSDVIAEARVLLNKLKNVVLDGMSCHLSSVPHLSKLQQMEANITKARKETEEIRKETEEIRKETEVAQAKVARLEALLAKKQAVKRKPRARRTTISRNRLRATLFAAPTTSQSSTTEANNPILSEHNCAP